ncbi:helix-turn-helix domain-containing protein [Demequina sp. NBRC 110054]|uniref:helix-turn-helix domain-containing protein n=1 Tax=Demequina sp. NBRC 110054 TaxID=1570343 RepID=UPI0009FE6D78|nr:helix-turn-helix transcriptional regulator [Demequina sp. NBRC 110054]
MNQELSVGAEDAWGAWTRRVGRNVAAARERRGMSARELAERTRALGFEVPRNSIANLESGRKGSVSIAEVAALAGALEVAPLVLLFDPEGADAEFLPGREAAQVVAADWFAGLQPEPRSDGPMRASDLDYAGALPLYRRHREVAARLSAFARSIEIRDHAVAWSGPTDGDCREWVQRLLRVRAEIREHGYRELPIEDAVRGLVDRFGDDG